jgi:hypothetical protein
MDTREQISGTFLCPCSGLFSFHRTPKVSSSLLAFYTLARDINLPIKSEKTVYLTMTLTFLGLELDRIDTLKMGG